jgi:hypothetical protein
VLAMAGGVCLGLNQGGSPTLRQGLTNAA